MHNYRRLFCHKDVARIGKAEERSNGSNKKEHCTALALVHVHGAASIKKNYMSSDTNLKENLLVWYRVRGQSGVTFMAICPSAPLTARFFLLNLRMDDRIDDAILEIELLIELPLLRLLISEPLRSIGAKF